MGQFGQELRREREARGIGLESITGSTKISGRHLIALEQEQFAALPGGVLNKGIVRGYARACGLDEEAWVGRYLSAYRESGEIKDDDRSWMEFAQNVGNARKGENSDPASKLDPDERMRWAGVAAMLLLLALFTWYVLGFLQAKTAGLHPPGTPHLRLLGAGRG